MDEDGGFGLARGLHIRADNRKGVRGCGMSPRGPLEGPGRGQMRRLSPKGAPSHGFDPTSPTPVAVSPDAARTFRPRTLAPMVVASASVPLLPARPARPATHRSVLTESPCGGCDSSGT